MNEDLEKAAKIIQSGGVIAFPTETVFGLGADATNADACRKIFEIKGRPSINPLIVHVESIAQAENIGVFNEDAYKLTKHFWPGPLSIVVPLKNGSNITAVVTAGHNTIALRMPAHSCALELIKKVACPIAAPSANLSGYISSTEASHVLRDFDNADIFILQNNEEHPYGLESTIIDLTGQTPAILRYGFIPPEAIESLLQKRIEVAGPLIQIKAPGMMDKHYSPRAKLRLNAEYLKDGEIGLNFGASKLSGNYCMNLSEKADLTEAAGNLYKMLRVLDEYAAQKDIRIIAVAKVVNSGIGLAINDRLKRAAVI